MTPAAQTLERHPEAHLGDAGATAPTFSLASDSVEPCPGLLMPHVGGDAQAGAAACEMSSDELEHEIHIEDCHWQYRTAYERFELWGCPHDREEALLHLHRMNAAILARSPRVQAARHAAFERALDEQVAFFSSESAVELGRVGGAT